MISEKIRMKEKEEKILRVKDPLGIFDELPDEIERVILEKDEPPRLSGVRKGYYFLRPVIPVGMRRLLQRNRNVNVEDDWFISERLIELYLKSCGEDVFWNALEGLWERDVVSPLVLTHDVESYEGLKFVETVIEIEEKYGFRSSFNVVPFLYDVPDEILSLIKERGFETGVHGFNHDGKDYFSKKIFDKRAVYINEAIEKYGAFGYRSPLVHRNLEWLQCLNIKYDLSCFDVDPFQMMAGGTHCLWPFKAGKFVEMPYTLPQDHVLWIQLSMKDNSVWKRKTDWLMKYRGMMLMLTHPDYLMIGDNMKLYEEFLAYLKELKGVKNYLPFELAERVMKSGEEEK